MQQHEWTFLTHYDQDHLYHIALPLGGIGTGTVSLGGRGDLRDWEVYSHPDKGFVPQNTFFALRAQPEGGEAVTRLVEGTLEPWQFAGYNGAQAPNHGLPRFRQCSFSAAYPLGQVTLADPDAPLAVTLQAFNPLIPADAERSGIPLAVLRFRLHNLTDKPVHAALCGSLQNFIGCDSKMQLARENTNHFQQGEGFCGLLFKPGKFDEDSELYGTLALAVLETEGVTYRTAWTTTGWNTSLLDFWDDFSQDGRLEERSAAVSDVGAGALSADKPIGSLAAQIDLEAGETRSLTFLLAWHFPNRQTWTPVDPAGAQGGDPNRIGNYYAVRYRDAWEVIEKSVPQLPDLEAQTATFVRAFCEADLPHAVKEAALFNLACLRSQTAFRTADGRFYGWEAATTMPAAALARAPTSGTTSRRPLTALAAWRAPCARWNSSTPPTTTA